MSEQIKLSWLSGSVDCHFEANARIAIKNVVEGRPIFEGRVPSTLLNDGKQNATS